MKEMNVRYQNQGDYQLPCITAKEQNELHIGVWANRHKQYTPTPHRHFHRHSDYANSASKANCP